MLGWIQFCLACGAVGLAYMEVRRWRHRHHDLIQRMKAMSARNGELTVACAEKDDLILQRHTEGTLNTVASAVHECAVNHGFWAPDKANPYEKIALIHSELSELLEAFRHGDENNPSTHEGLRLNQADEELADVIIRALDLAAYLGLDIGGAVITKYEFNMARPMMHGKKA